MAVGDTDSLCAGTGVEETELAVTAGRGEGGADGVPRDALDRVAVAGELDDGRVLVALDVPDADEVVARGRREEALRGGVEDDLADLAAASIQLADGRNVGRRPAVVSPALEDRVLNVPQEDWGLARAWRCNSLLPSSPPETTKLSSNGDQAVSRLGR